MQKNYDDYSVFAQALADICIPDALNKLSEYEMKYTFSSEFERKMDRLIKKERKFYFPLIKTTSRKALMIAATIVIMLSAMCMSVSALRNTVVDLVSKVFVNTYDSGDTALSEKNAVTEISSVTVSDKPQSAVNTEPAYTNTVNTTSHKTETSRLTSALKAENTTVITTAAVTSETTVYSQANDTSGTVSSEHSTAHLDSFVPFPENKDLSGDNVVAVDRVDYTFDFSAYPKGTKFIKSSCVEVMIKRQYSEYGKIWTPEELGCGSIASSVEDYTGAYEPVRGAFEPVRNHLIINLAVTGKDKVAEIIDILSNRNEVMWVSPCYVYSDYIYDDNYADND